MPTIGNGDGDDDDDESMKLDIRAKLFAVSLGLIGVSVLAAEIYLRPASRRT